jgi:hypothetical protein
MTRAVEPAESFGSVSRTVLAERERRRIRSVRAVLFICFKHLITTLISRFSFLSCLTRFGKTRERKRDSFHRSTTRTINSKVLMN